MNEPRRTYAYAGGLIVGILFVTPVIGLGATAIGVPLTPALLAVLTAVAGAYGAVAFLDDSVHQALAVSILVLMTVSANVPLGPQPEGVAVGPNLFLVDGAMLLLGIISLRGWNRQHVGAEHALLGLYALWCGISIVVAPGPRPDVMVWYALHVSRYVVAFALLTRSITSGWIRARDALGVVALVTVSHGIVATVQVITGPIPALTILGSNPRVLSSLGPLPTGPYVGGFTGGSPFASLVIIAIPIVFAAGFSDRIPRVAALCCVAWLVFLLQLTAWDAARGALLVSLYVGLVVFGWWLTGVLWSRGALIRRVWRQRNARLAWVLAPAFAVAAIWQASRFGSNPNHDAVFLDPELGQDVIRNLSVPGFNTRNLGIRLHQYVGGVDVFLQYPLTGLGGANYNYIALMYADRQNMIHNFYIGVLAETGLVGAVLLFGALAVVCVRLWNVAETSDSPLWLGVIVGLVGFFALQFFQPHYLRAVTMVSFFAVSAAASGAYLKSRPTKTDRWANVCSRSVVERTIDASTTLRIAEMAPERVGRTMRIVWRDSAFQNWGEKTIRWLLR